MPGRLSVSLSRVAVSCVPLLVVSVTRVAPRLRFCSDARDSSPRFPVRSSRSRTADSPSARLVLPRFWSCPTGGFDSARRSPPEWLCNPASPSLAPASERDHSSFPTRIFGISIFNAFRTQRSFQLSDGMLFLGFGGSCATSFPRVSVVSQGVQVGRELLPPL